MTGIAEGETYLPHQEDGDARTMTDLLEDFYDGIERRAEEESRREDKWFLFGVVWFSAWFLVFLGLCFLG